MRGLALALTLALVGMLAARPALAQPDLPDAPRAIRSGEVVTGDGVWVSSATAAAMAGQHTRCLAERDQLRESLEAKPAPAPQTSGGVSAGVVAVVGLVSLLAGMVAGVLVMR